jgi:hypothetical protein
MHRLSLVKNRVYPEELLGVSTADCQGMARPSAELSARHVLLRLCPRIHDLVVCYALRDLYSAYQVLPVRVQAKLSRRSSRTELCHMAVFPA